VRVELYADGADGADPVRQEMISAGPLVGVPGAYRYRAMVCAVRPATDYTVRVVPRFDGVAIPLEAAQIRWQR
jgi:starch phosphorylase